MMIVFAIFTFSLSSLAQAQATRTWVSGVGDDANPCSRTAPCKTFAGAISKTAAHGEINVLDPGGFGGVTITKSISIISAGFEAGVLVSGTNGIVVNVLATDKVLLEGLDIEGLGSGLNGINIIGGGKVHIRRSSIRNFTQNGVSVVGAAGAGVLIEDTLISSNAGGLNVQTTSVGNYALLRNSVVHNNSNFATQVNGAATILVLMGSTLSGSPTSIANVGGASVISYGNNVIRNTGAPTQTLPMQ